MTHTGKTIRIPKRLRNPVEGPFAITHVAANKDVYSFKITNNTDEDRYIDKVWACLCGKSNKEQIDHVKIETILPASESVIVKSPVTEVGALKGIQFLSMAQVATYDRRYGKTPAGLFRYNQPIPVIATNNLDSLVPVDIPVLSASLNDTLSISFRPYLRRKVESKERISLFEVIYAAYSDQSIVETWGLSIRNTLSCNDRVKGMLCRTFWPSVQTVQLVGIQTNLGETPLNAVLSRSQDGRLHYNRGNVLPLNAL